MISFLFWNLNANPEAAACIAGIGRTYAVDVFLFAECPAETGPLLTGLNALHRGIYHAPARIRTKVQFVTRLPPSHLTPLFTNVGGDMTIWRLRTDLLPAVFLAAMHLPSKAGGVKETDQQAWAQEVSREIAEFEDRENCEDTLLVGDLNMNPFDPGVVSVTGLHGLITTALASQPPRRHRGKPYRRFYNPMWGLFGDRTSGPAGTHFWDSSVPSNQHWQILDQVLLRPSLMKRLRALQILEGDGYRSFLGSNKVPSREHLSDHLPILFQLDV
jgi:hypothetical protein